MCRSSRTGIITETKGGASFTVHYPCAPATGTGLIPPHATGLIIPEVGVKRPFVGSLAGSPGEVRGRPFDGAAHRLFSVSTGLSEPTGEVASDKVLQRKDVLAARLREPPPRLLG